MLNNKKMIYFFLMLSIISFFLSILFTLIFENKYLSWFQGFAFAILGSSLIALFTAIISYSIEKSKNCEKISSIVLHMSNDVVTELYHPGSKIHLEKIAHTIGLCCKSCFDLLITLNEYKNGLFIFNKERKIVNNFIQYVIYNQQINYFALGIIVKENKENIKCKLEVIYKILLELIDDENMFKYAKLINYKNNSKMDIRNVEDDELISKRVKDFRDILFKENK